MLYNSKRILYMVKFLFHITLHKLERVLFQRLNCNIDKHFHESDLILQLYLLFEVTDYKKLVEGGFVIYLSIHISLGKN